MRFFIFKNVNKKFNQKFEFNPSKLIDLLLGLLWKEFSHIASALLYSNMNESVDKKQFLHSMGEIFIF